MDVGEWADRVWVIYERKGGANAFAGLLRALALFFLSPWSLLPYNTQYKHHKHTKHREQQQQQQRPRELGRASVE